jgi:hypothetical protein
VRGLLTAYGLLALLIPGFWISLDTCLPEPLAAATLGGGIYCVSQRRWVVGAALFAATLLIRETGIVALVCVLAATARRERTAAPFVTAAVAIGVLAAWRGYLGAVLYPAWGWQAWFYHPPDLATPFSGFVQLAHAIGAGAYYPGSREVVRAGIAFPLLLVFATMLAVTLASVAPNAITIAAVVYGSVAVSLNYANVWVHVANGQRVTYELFLMLALATLGIREYGRGVQVALCALWAAAGVYILFVGMDAINIRGALALPI